MLGGKCRHCRCRISIRYPTIEAITAAMFVGLAVAENPLLTIHRAEYPYHVLLLCTLLSSALIEIDGNRPPVRLFIPALIVGIAAPFIWPIRQPILFGWDPGVFGPIFGFLGGVVLSVAVELLSLVWRKFCTPNAADARSVSNGVIYGLICIGTFLGRALSLIVWPALVVHAILLLSGRDRTRIRVPPSVWLLLGTMTWLLIR
jgi:leader peptidase (prepilin peptidase) / N-methyltransferase